MRHGRAMRKRTYVAKRKRTSRSDPADPLFAVPPKEFVKARDALARELATAGDEAGAARVKGMKRPNAAVWAVNALARREGKAVAEYLEAGERLREAHRSAIASGGGDALRAALRQEGELATDLVAKAAALLVAQGLSASSATTEKIRETLTSAARAGGEIAEVVRAGRVEHELSPAAVEAAPATVKAPRRGKGRLSAAKRREEERRAKKEAAERRRAEEKARREAAKKQAKARRERERAERLLELAEEARRRAMRLEAEARE